MQRKLEPISLIFLIFPSRKGSLRGDAELRERTDMGGKR